MAIQASVIKSSADKYQIRSERGNEATIYVESGEHVDDLRPDGGWGRITIQSSFGGFAAYWGSCGSDFGKFLAGMDFDYAMKNLRNYQHREFDAQATIANIRKTIISDRRDGGLTKDDARAAWDYLKEAKKYDDSFLIGYLRESGMDFYCDVALWAGCTKYRDDCVGFWEDIWPLFIGEVYKPVTTSQLSQAAIV